MKAIVGKGKNKHEEEVLDLICCHDFCDVCDNCLACLGHLPCYTDETEKPVAHTLVLTEDQFKYHQEREARKARCEPVEREENVKPEPEPSRKPSRRARRKS